MNKERARKGLFYLLSNQVKNPKKMEQSELFRRVLELLERTNPLEEEVGETLHVMDTVSSHLFTRYLLPELRRQEWVAQDTLEDDFTEGEDVDDEPAMLGWLHARNRGESCVRVVIREDGVVGLIGYYTTEGGQARIGQQAWTMYGRMLDTQATAQVINDRNVAIREKAKERQKTKKR